MADLLGNLGKSLGARLRAGNWILQHLTGTENEPRSGVPVGAAPGGRNPKATRGSCKPRGSSETHQLTAQLGALLVAKLANKQRRFEFTITQSAAPNAFALPGGFIFVERSLLQLCQWDRDEVGFILGHEMAHVVLGHAFDRFAGGKAIDLAARVLVLGKGPLGAASIKPCETSSRGPIPGSRNWKRTSSPARLAMAAGCNFHGSIRLLQRLRCRSDMPDGAVPASYFADHPPLEERMDRLKKYARAGLAPSAQVH